ncbi:hypothetical protein P4S63_14940 [Pseudoalteromonas sp. B193]
MSLSVVGAWSFKHVSLENKDNIVFQADFLNSPVPQVTKLISNSYGASIGSLLSFSLPHNVHVFAEYKVGKGHIQNTNPGLGLKDSVPKKLRHSVVEFLGLPTIKNLWSYYVRGSKQAGI